MASIRDGGEKSATAKASSILSPPHDRKLTGQLLPKALKHWINSIPKQSCALVNSASDLFDGACMYDAVSHILGESTFHYSNASISAAGRVRSAICVVADKLGWDALPPEFTDAQYSQLVSSGDSTRAILFMDFLQTLEGRLRSSAMVRTPSETALTDDDDPRRIGIAGSESEQHTPLISGDRPSYRVVSRFGQLRTSARKTSLVPAPVSAPLKREADDQRSPHSRWREFDVRSATGERGHVVSADWDPSIAAPVKTVGRSVDVIVTKEIHGFRNSRVQASAVNTASVNKTPKTVRKGAATSAADPPQSIAGEAEPQSMHAAAAGELTSSQERHVRCMLPDTTQQIGDRTSTRTSFGKRSHVVQLFAPVMGNSWSEHHSHAINAVPLDRMNAIMRWIQIDLDITIDPIIPATTGNSSATSISVAEHADRPTSSSSPFLGDNLYRYRPEYEEDVRYTLGKSSDQLGGFSVSSYLGHLTDDDASGYLGHMAGSVVHQQRPYGRDHKGRPSTTSQGFLGDPWINGILLAEVVAALSRQGSGKHVEKQVASYDRFGRLQTRPRSVLRGVEVSVRSRAQAVHNIALCLDYLQQMPGFPCIDYNAKNIVDGRVSLWRVLSTAYETFALVDDRPSDQSRPRSWHGEPQGLGSTIKMPRLIRRRSLSDAAAAIEGTDVSVDPKGITARPSSAPPTIGAIASARRSDDGSISPKQHSTNLIGKRPAQHLPTSSVRMNGSALARTRDVEMKEERRRARTIDRRNRSKLLIRAGSGGKAEESGGVMIDGGSSRGKTASVDVGDDGARKNSTASSALGGDQGVVNAATKEPFNSGTTAPSKSSDGDPKTFRPPIRRRRPPHYLWSPPQLSPVEVAAAKTAHVPTISKPQQATVRQWLSTLSIHLVDGEGGFVFAATQTDALAVRALRSVPAMPLKDDRMRNGDLFGLLLCALEPDLAIHANIPRLMVGGSSRPVTVELCMANLERVFWLMRLRMCPRIPLVYLCQPKAFLEGNRDLIWGLVWEIMQLYSTSIGSMGRTNPSQTSLQGWNKYVPGVIVPEMEQAGVWPKLPYSSRWRRQLDLSLLSWLDECGLLREIGGDLCRPSTVLSLESYLRDGTLLCMLVERLFLPTALSSRLHAQWHWHRHPTTHNQCLLNLRSCFSVLRSCRDMRIRFLYAGAEEDVLKGRWDCILGLLEDMHRCADGLHGVAVTGSAETPYLGRFPSTVGAEVGPSPTPSDAVVDPIAATTRSSLLHDALGGSFDRTLSLHNFVVSDQVSDQLPSHRKESFEDLQYQPQDGSTDLNHGTRSSVDLYPTAKPTEAVEHLLPVVSSSSYAQPVEDEDVPSKYRDLSLAHLDPSLNNAYGIMAQPESSTPQEPCEDQDLVNQTDDDASVDATAAEGRLRDPFSPDSLSPAEVDEDSVQAGRPRDGDDAMDDSPSPLQGGNSRTVEVTRVNNVSMAILRFRQTKLIRWLREEGLCPAGGSMSRLDPAHPLPADLFSDGVILCELVGRLERCHPLPGTHSRPTCATHRIQNVRRCLELLAHCNKRIPLRELSCEQEVLSGDIDRTIDLFFSIRKAYRGRRKNK